MDELHTFSTLVDCNDYAYDSRGYNYDSVLG